eukprot:Mycagemm_TRINITY_DN10087_c0_g1::TRINITY_DN10087_c0_g1_i1::g.2063::m.2063 type:complete len:109 gc:universal TRINITY_DN10087_c0_g1_i1:423-97(-)
MRQIAKSPLSRTSPRTLLLLLSAGTSGWSTRHTTTHRPRSRLTLRKLGSSRASRSTTSASRTVPSQLRPTRWATLPPLRPGCLPTTHPTKDQCPRSFPRSRQALRLCR